VFGLHPLRVESVVWITERRDVLSLFFYLTTVLAWLRAVGVERHRARFYWGAVVLFLCALLSKATAMTLPAVLLLLDVYPLRRLSSSNWRDLRSDAVRRIYFEILPFAFLSLCAIVLSIVALHPPTQLPLGAKLAVSAFSLCFYLWKSIVPTGLSPLYEMPQHVNPFDGMYVASYVAIAVLIVGAIVVRKRWPGLVAAFAGFVIISLPMLGIVQNGPQIAADRYTYHSAPALALIAGAALFLVLQIQAWARFTVGGVALAALSIATLGQTFVWHDSEVLWLRVLAVEPSSGLGHSGYSSLLFEQDRVPEGLAQAKAAVEAAPGLAEGHNDLGVGLTRTGDPDAGIAEYQRALALKPTDDEAENNWGVAEARRGNLAEALKHYQRALELNPDYADAHVNIGNLLVRELKQDEAIPHYVEALRIRPDDADAHFNWGVALAQQGKYDDAIAHFRDAMAIRPNFEVAKQYIERATRLQAAKQTTATPPTNR
jgi:tetratricopeptide (TPR) repeat protein